jgi:K+ transporter
MRRTVYVLLAIEALLLIAALARLIAGNAGVLMLAVNSVLLIWAATRLRRKPSCCR